MVLSLMCSRLGVGPSAGPEFMTTPALSSKQLKVDRNPSEIKNGKVAGVFLTSCKCGEH